MKKIVDNGADIKMDNNEDMKTAKKVDKAKEMMSDKNPDKTVDILTDENVDKNPEIIRLKSRSIIFRFLTEAGWYYNVQLIIGDQYYYLIDTGLGSGSMASVLKYIDKEVKPVILINTHYHWDHVWGNWLFSDCHIISHKLCREIIESKWEEMLHKNGQYISGETKICLPNMVFDKELYFPEDHIRLIYTPGHTIDSISVIDEVDKVINAGDNIGDNMEEILPSIYSNMDLYRETILQYRDVDIDTVVSGHNDILAKNIFDEILKSI